MVEPPHRPIRKIARIPPIAISAPTPKLNTWRTSGWHDSKEIPGIRSSGERGPGRKGSGTSPSHARAAPSGLMSHHSWAWAEWLLDVWGTILQYRTHRNNTTWFNSLARTYIFVKHIFGYSNLYIYIYINNLYIIYMYIIYIYYNIYIKSNYLHAYAQLRFSTRAKVTHTFALETYRHMYCFAYIGPISLYSDHDRVELDLGISSLRCNINNNRFLNIYDF
jgi:hypothetical protein